MSIVRPRQHKSKILRRPELEGEPGQGRGQERQPEDGNGAGDEGADCSNAQSRACAPLPGHLVAVQAGDHGGRFTGNIDQDGSCGAPIHGAVINASQHDDGRFGGGLEGGGKEQGHGTHGPDPRQYTDQSSDEYPGETIK